MSRRSLLADLTRAATTTATRAAVWPIATIIRAACHIGRAQDTDQEND